MSHTNYLNNPPSSNYNFMKNNDPIHEQLIEDAKDRHILSNNSNNNNDINIWSPTDTRVFDIYTLNDATKKIPFLDVFSEEFHPKISSIKQELPHSISIADDDDFISGSQSKNHTVSNLSSTPHHNNTADDGVVLPSNRKGGLSQMDITSMTVSNNTTTNNNSITPITSTDDHHPTHFSNDSPSLHSNHTNNDDNYGESDSSSSANSQNGRSVASNSSFTRDTTDKWSSEVEDAFLASLKLIAKKGTSKIKLLDKNYGRNELISLYIYYHTNEFRTKKQISSHIQVWKKGINSKRKNNLTITESELELFHLIENGAPKLSETITNFNNEFKVIIEKLEKEASTDKNHQLHESFPMLGVSTKKKTTTDLNSDYDDYNSLITPNSAGYNLKSKDDLGKNGSNNIAVPTYPVEYAKSMYESMPEYRCLPVGIGNTNTYHPYRDHNSRIAKSEGDIFRGKLMSRNEAIEDSLKIESKQRDLIETMGKSLQSPNNDNTNTNNNNSNNDNTNNFNTVSNLSNPGISNDSSYYMSNFPGNNDNVIPITNTHYPNNYIYNNGQPFTNNIPVAGNVQPNTDYYSGQPQSQWNGNSQYAVVQPAPPIDHRSSHVGATDASGPQPGQSFAVPQTNRMITGFTPAEPNFPNSYPPQWFSPNNQPPPSSATQYNFGPTQYLQMPGQLDNGPLLRQQQHNGQAPPSVQQSYYQYPSHAYTPGNGNSNTTPTYQTFNTNKQSD
ncbi:hypothetical protein MOSE0_J03400 [Monosporozyma servazzii]